MDAMTPLKLLAAASKKYPQLKYAWAVVGISAAAAIVATLIKSEKPAVVVGILVAMFAAMLLMAEFANDRKMHNGDLGGPSFIRQFLVLAAAFVFVLVLVGYASALVFGHPEWLAKQMQVAGIINPPPAPITVNPPPALITAPQLPEKLLLGLKGKAHSKEGNRGEFDSQLIVSLDDIVLYNANQDNNFVDFKRNNPGEFRIPTKNKGGIDVIGENLRNFQSALTNGAQLTIEARFMNRDGGDVPVITSIPFSYFINQLGSNGSVTNNGGVDWRFLNKTVYVDFHYDGKHVGADATLEIDIR